VITSTTLGSTLPASVDIRDVTLRDGLQDERPISLEAKVAIAESLVAAGVRELELTSFVRADRVPALADAEAFCEATRHLGVVRWGLVLNRRGAERALAAGIDHLQYVVSVSDSHSRRNAGLSPAEALSALEDVAGSADTSEHGAVIEVTLATAFGCPYERVVDVRAVVEAAKRAAAAGATSIGLADTIGVAVPTEVASLVAAVRAAIDVPVGTHLHDTRGLAIANAIAAIGNGATRLDASVGGLGGCPFAPGASGNVPIEDLVHALEAMGVGTGCSVTGLVGAAAIACAAVGRQVGSHVGMAGPRFAPPVPLPR
jgi:hydroxymethylglutaryl-CoA lyase